ncbi:MAG TPA: ABC transporter permease, partial [Limnochorda sp.]
MLARRKGGIGLLRFLANRLLQSFITLLVFVAVTFAILQAMPGDITLLFLQNPKIPPEVREAIRQRLGLDRPILIQFLEHVKNVFTGNLGVSFSQYPRPVWDIIAERLPRTVT